MNDTATTLEQAEPGRATRATLKGIAPAGSGLRLVYLVSQYPALSHTFIEREIAELERRGHEVEIVSVRRPANLEKMGETGFQQAERTFFLLAACQREFIGAFWRLFWNKKVRLRCMFTTWLRAIKANPLHPGSYAYFMEAVVLVDWMLRKRLKHVHNHFGNAAGTVALIANASHAVTYSLSIHGPDIFYDAANEMLTEKLNAAVFVRAISDFCKSQLCLLSNVETWPRFHVVRCGVDPEVFVPRPQPRKAIPSVLCVGRLVPAKGQAILLEASRLLLERGIPHTLTFAGGGPDEAALKAHAGGHVTFTGGIDQAGVRALLARADLFVLPSFAEGVPVVLMEAMSCQIPVISTTIAGIPELIETGKSGLLVPPSNVSALASAMEKLLRDPALARELGEAGRRQVQAAYTLAPNGRQLASLFERILNS